MPQEVGRGWPAAVALAAVLSVAAPALAADAGQGERVFATKQCARCHRPAPTTGGAPPLEALRRPQGAYVLAGRLWNHVPAMFTALKQEGLEWPRIEEGEMADLMAYLGADPARDPSANVVKGQMTLVNKGCLKCHRFRGEGERAGLDLSERRDELAPAARWAARMWQHAPRMAATAIERGILYPRFAGDEMLDLVGFLRTRSAAR